MRSLLVAALLLGAAARAETGYTIDGSAVRLTDGAASLAVAPRLVLDVRDGEAAKPRERVLAPAVWRASATEGGFAVEAEAADADVRVRFSVALAGGDAAPALTVEVEHLRAAWVHLVALDLELPPGVPSVLDRALAPRPVNGAAYLDRFAAKQVRTGDHLLLIDDGVDGAIVRTGAGGPARLRVELFSVEERPFHHDAHCARRWRSPNKKVQSPARLRLRGEREVARIVLAVGRAHAAALAKARFPSGRRAALTITDHADQSAPLALAALALGRSDAASPVGGLLGHHLAITKSLFFHGGGKRHQLDDPVVARIAEELAAGGNDVVPHSATPKPDPRPVTEAALAAFARFHASTWIDHQPETNCEAFSNEGWRASGKFHIGDLLAAHGYRYVWAAEDAPPGELDLLGGGHLERRAPTLWPLGRLTTEDPADGDRWLFRSTWMFIERKRFLAALAPPRIDALERARGLAVLHTYLETLHPKRTRFGLRNLLVARGSAVVLDPGFDELLAELERRADRGTLWTAPIAQIGDHLRAVEQAVIRYGSDGAATLLSPVEVKGLTLVVRGNADPIVDGKAPLGIKRDKDETTFWFDLPAQKPVRIELRGGRFL